MIHYIEHKDIDFKKWDACISNSSNRLIYGFSWYLDVVCDDWDALVLNDYEAVFPLPKRKKWGIEYIYQPFFCQQLGVFSKKELDADLFLNSIPEKFKYIELNINTNTKYCVKRNVNHILSLEGSIDDLYKNFSSSHKKSIQKAQKTGINIASDSIKDFMLQKEMLAKGHMDAHQFRLLRNVMKTSLSNSNARFVSASLEGEKVGSVFLLVDNKRLTLLTSYSTSKGRQVGAFFFIFNHLLSLYQKMEFTFDFEGSNLSGVAKRNEGFGAKKTYYYTVKINRLPFYLKWFKS